MGWRNRERPAPVEADACYAKCVETHWHGNPNPFQRIARRSRSHRIDSAGALAGEGAGLEALTGCRGKQKVRL